MRLAKDWKDYRLIDTMSGDKLEYWGKYKLRRPDPQVVWDIPGNKKQWSGLDGWYHRSSTGGGHWEFFNRLPESWTISYKNLKFNIKPMGFKHTGLFPEQAVNWDYMIDKIKKANRPINVLNLFAYTGGATVACASAGASVCHVDSSKGMVTWAKENINVSGLADKPVRFIVDDVVKFVEREIRRGKKYDAIVMDPPSYGRGAKGEVWNIEEDLFGLVQKCTQILSDDPIFFLVNSYTSGLAPTIVKNILELTVNKKVKGKISSDEIGLPIEESGLALPCGITTIWERE